MHMPSRFILALLGASLACIGVAAAQTEIKVGVVSTMSGPDAQPGDEMNKGIDLYVKTHEKDLPPALRLR